MDKIICITGASGFIGSNLFARFGKRYKFRALKSDLLDYQGLKSELELVQPEIIIHLAARTEVEKSFYEPTSFARVNFEGTVGLVEAARESCRNLKLFLFSSTMETYGWQPISDDIRDGKVIEPTTCFNETTAQNPNAPYAVAKVGCEQYLSYAHRSFDFPFCTLRQTNTYGRDNTDFFVVEQIISQMLKGSTCRLGYAKPWRNFLYIDDLLECYAAVLANPEKVRGKTFCLGPNNALSIESLAHKIAKLINWKGEIIWDTKPERVGEIYFLNSSPDLIKTTLGWEPKVGLELGLKRTIELWKHKLAPRVSGMSPATSD